MAEQTGDIPRKRGRPSKPYEELAKRTKRENAQESYEDVLKANFPREEFIEAVIRYLNKSEGGRDRSLAGLLQYGYKNTEKIESMLKHAKSKKREAVSLKAADGLGLILDYSLTRHQYDGIRQQVNTCGVKVLPCYDLVLAEKSLCRPPKETVKITDTSARVHLSALLNHTVTRIALMQKESIIKAQNDKGIQYENCTFIVPWGFDGSTGQSNYKQRYETSASAIDDSSLIATTINPQRLVNETGHIYSSNPSPQSIRYCRPLHLQFAKETNVLVMKEKDTVEQEILALTPLVINLDSSHKIVVTFYLCLSMIDGKILNMITNTRYSLACPICSATSADFNTLEYIGTSTFEAKEERLAYGISPTHCWIRSLEFVISLACKLSFESWEVHKSYRAEFNENKQLLRDRLWQEMHLRVSLPNSNGSGNSNDGNTARRLFFIYAQFADILGIDEEVIKGLRTILIVLNCQLAVNVDKFEKFCLDWFSSYLALYSCNNLTPSVHKIIVHGGEIIKASIIPVGMLGEEASEAQNKVYKSDRIHHTRKISRLMTMEDLYYRSVDASDPVMSTMSQSVRSKFKKHLPLPQEVIDLLQCPASSTPSTSLDETVLEQFQEPERVLLEEE